MHLNNPEYDNRSVLAHKGLQEQPEGVLKGRNESFSLFALYQRVSTPRSHASVGRFFGSPANSGGDVDLCLLAVKMGCLLPQVPVPRSLVVVLGASSLVSDGSLLPVEGCR